MKTSHQFLSEFELQQVNDAIAAAEKRTSGEIVVAVASSSGRYDRAEGIVGILVALAFVCVAWTFSGSSEGTTASWAVGASGAPGLFQALLAVVVGYLTGNVLSTFFPSLRLPFIPAREMDEEVARRAHEVFVAERISSTGNGTGVLILISLYEHRIQILPDHAIADKVDNPVWGGVRDLIRQGMVDGTPANGIAQAVSRCGDLLSAKFPISEDDTDELPNTVRLLD